MASLRVDGPFLQVATDRYTATIATEGYTSGVMAGSFVDLATGAHDLGHGLAIADFLLEAGEDTPDTPEELRYHFGDPYHGDLRKRYVELPQICTLARKLPCEVVEGRGFVAVRQWFTWSVARPPYRPGSTWEQWLIFPDGERWFLACDRVSSVNTVDGLILRQDIPGHLKHTRGDSFQHIYLSHVGCLPAEAFFDDFAPHERHLYNRPSGTVREPVIRGYQTTAGPWVAGMALDPGIVYQGWCHQRGYVCFIQEIGGRRVAAGESFGAVHLIGFFDDPDDMHRTFAEHAGAGGLSVSASGWRLS
ncbi:MAG: hypothetical protein HYU66_29705 [Armatimonadetes bacterium]|nr:hypothetical protein [Armatimonadota bacterium]